jgi:prevent-host-death family protein
MSTPTADTPQAGPDSWKLEDAKARFSELVRRASAEGPQAVTVRGRRAVVVMDAGDYDRLVAPRPRLGLVEFLESLDLAGLDLAREPDGGREVEV